MNCNYCKDTGCNFCRESGTELASPVEPIVSQHFNQLTPAEAERLAVLAEECGETIQMVGKILRHGYESSHPDGGPTNRQQLERELGDILAAMDMLCEPGTDDLDSDFIHKSRYAKHKRVKRYLHHAG